MTDAADATIEEIVAACASMEGLPYDGEPVDQLQHALQCAAIATVEGPPGDEEFVVACLLHDIARAPAVAGIQYDGPTEDHGAAAARWLTPRLGPRVAWLAEQHVPAKRYLVATDPSYLARLSTVSQHTLIMQGGAMSAAQVSEFERSPDHRLAVRLRLIDDRGKAVGLDVPGIDAYRPALHAVAARYAAGAP